MFELVAVVGVMTLLLLIAVSNLKELNRPLLNGTAHVTSYLKQVRAKALTATSAYEIYPLSPTELRARFANSCNATEFTDDPLLTLTMPDGAVIVESEWTVCFNSRGLASDNVTISVQDLDLQQRQVEVLLGGSVRVM